MNRIQAKDKPHLQQLIKQAFDEGICDLNFIDTSLVGDMNHLFGENEHDFDVSHWEVSQVTDMSYMFSFCKSFNQDLSQWDVSQVTDMSYMFQFCGSFDQDLSQWNVSQVAYMDFMFAGCGLFNQDLSQWDVSQVTSMDSMFKFCESFDQDLSQWDVSKVRDMSCMFENAVNFDLAYIPRGFYQNVSIYINIDLEQGIKDLIDTLDHTNLELALNLANNVDKLQEARQYIAKAIFDGWLFGKFDLYSNREDEVYRAKAGKIIQSLLNFSQK